MSGDRHGAKAHRSDSRDKDHEPSKMVDSTDDPNIFNTHGLGSSKVPLLWNIGYLGAGV